MAEPFDDGGGEHPFLTRRGLWLQQNGRLDGVPSMPLSVPGNVPSNGPRNGPSIGSPRVIDAAGSRFQTTPIPFPHVRPSDSDSSAIWSSPNLRPSRKYPEPMRLREGTLAKKFQTRLANAGPGDVRRAVGKLLADFPGDPAGSYASGSAWIVGGNTIATAAHLLFDSNKRHWANRLSFCPGYDFYDSVEAATCRVVSASLPRAYLANPLTNHDLAICRVDRNIGDEIGSEIPIRPIDGIEFFDDHPVTICGYPAASGFDFAKQLWQTRGDFLFGLSGGGDDEHAPAIATDFGGGASGCPWLYRDPEDDRIVAVGVTSGHAKLRHDVGEPNLMTLTSPLFCRRVIDRLDNDFVSHVFA